MKASRSGGVNGPVGIVPLLGALAPVLAGLPENENEHEDENDLEESPFLARLPPGRWPQTLRA
jgi:hypothetical protein